MVGGGIGDLVEGRAAQANGLTALGLEDLKDVGEGPAPVFGFHGAGSEFVALIIEEGREPPGEVPLR